jgi:hypothetical protein
MRPCSWMRPQALPVQGYRHCPPTVRLLPLLPRKGVPRHPLSVLQQPHQGPRWSAAAAAT